MEFGNIVGYILCFAAIAALVAYTVKAVVVMKSQKKMESSYSEMIGILKPVMGDCIEMFNALTKQMKTELAKQDEDRSENF